MLVFVLPVNARTFYVMSEFDFPDSNPGDGSAVSTNGLVTLRSAVEEANAWPGRDIVKFDTSRGWIEFFRPRLENSQLVIEEDLEIDASASGTISAMQVLRTTTDASFRDIYINTDIHLTLRRIQFRTGKDIRGGGVYMEQGSVLELIQSGIIGEASDRGGGVYNDNGTVIVEGTRAFIGGTANSSGGGVFNNDGIVLVRDGSIGGISEENGGGIYNTSDGVVEFRDSNYWENQFSLEALFSGEATNGKGGGIYNSGGTVRIFGCSVGSNSKSHLGGAIASEGGLVDIVGLHAYEANATHGGAIYFDSTTVTISHSIFGGGLERDDTPGVDGGNSAADAGGSLWIGGGSDVTISNSTFAGGSSVVQGGAIYVEESDLSLVNVTMMENTVGPDTEEPKVRHGASLGGGAIATGTNATVRIGNSIVAQNTSASSMGSDVFGDFVSLGNNFIGIIDEYSTGLGIDSDIAGTPTNPSDPMMNAFSYNGGNSLLRNYLPLSDSPVIDAGNTSLLSDVEYVNPSPAHDQRGLGFARYQGVSVDIGAIEVQGDMLDAAAVHSADQNSDGALDLLEVLRVIQFFNSDGFHCDLLGEDGYTPGPGDESCPPHTADYSPQDWRVSLGELLRLIQLHNANGYETCPDADPPTEDGYCPVI